MTYRQFLKKKIRTGLSYAFIGMLPVLVGLYVIEGALGKFLGVLGLVSVICGLVYLCWFVKCPKCKANIDLTFLSSGFGPHSSDRMNYCSACGLDLDSIYEYY